MKIIWNEPGEASPQGEDGVTEFVTKCEQCGKYANMVYKHRGPRGAILKGRTIACSRACGEIGASMRAFVPLSTSQLVELVTQTE